MVKYVEAVCRCIVLGDKELTVYFKEYLDPMDKFGKASLRKVFVRNILNTPHEEHYTQLLKEHEYVHNIDLVRLLHEQVLKYGWCEFLMGIKTLVRLYLRRTQLDKDKVRLFKVVDILSDIPKTVVIPRNLVL